MTRYLLALLLAAPALAQAPNLERMDVVQRSLPDGPVALVDGAPITRGDFLFLYQSQCMILASQGKKLDDTTRIKAGITTLAELVQREILNQLGERRKLDIPQSKVNEAYADQMKTLIERFSTDEFTPTENDLLERSGQTKEDALRDIRKALMVDLASDALADEKKVTVSDAEARDFYNKYQERFQRPGMLHLKQIYVRPGKDPATATEKDWADAEKKVRNAAARFQVGDTFEAVARSMSDGKDREQGGDMEMRPASNLPPVYVERSKSMKEGETSEPFRSEFGWHIIRLMARESEADIPFEKARDGIKRQLREIKKLAVVEDYCRPIMADAGRVQIFLDLKIPEDAAANTR